MKTILFSLIALCSVAQAHDVSLTDHNYLASLQSIAPGQPLQLKQVTLGSLGPVTLNLRRFRVFAEDAQVTIHGQNGSRHEPMPDNVYFMGNVQNSDNSQIFIGFLANGEIEGILDMADGTKYTLKWQQNKRFTLHKPDTQALTNSDNRFYNPKDYIELPDSQIRKQRAQSKQQRGPTIDYQLTVAIESDYEFYQIFNDSGDTVNYITSLIAYLSSMYYNEINTFVLLGHISIWTNSNDPWDATKTDCALYEVGKYWNDNQGAIDRAITHFLSGKNMGGGIAWKGVLCQSEFNYNISGANCNLGNSVDNYGGGYGVSGSLSGSFNPNNPQVVWDVVVTSHEIGHNFNSPHTHCYGGIGGNANPVDECYSSEPNCYAGAQSLPGPVGQGSGTIMSYCHLLSGGLSNISLKLGTNHPYGTEPVRVTNQMRTHVESVAGNNPQCIMPAANDLIFANGFE